MTQLAPEEMFGPLTEISCPECGGALRRMDDQELPRYRCHVGHAFTEESLLGGQGDAIERSLWAALRALKERAELLRRMANTARENGHTGRAAEYEQQAAESFAHADQLREFIRRSGESPETAAPSAVGNGDPNPAA